jgi:hypothetical protein
MKLPNIDNGAAFMNKLTLTALLATASLLTALVITPAMAQGKNKEMSCKLQSDKLKGKERTCIYVCPDKSIEGRTRTANNSCPAFVNSQKN